MTNLFETVTPVCATEFYNVYIEENEHQPVEIQGFPYTEFYSVVNNDTEVIEYKTNSLPQAISYAIMAGAEIERYDEFFEKEGGARESQDSVDTSAKVVSLRPIPDKDE